MPKHIDWRWEQLGDEFPGSKKRICITGAEQELTGHIVFPTWLEGLPVTDIGDRAFVNQRKLTAVTLPEGIERIHPAAFDACTALRKVRFPSTLKRLDDCAFRGCIALQEADIHHVDELFGEIFLGCASLRRVRLSKRLTKIPPRTFKGCQALADINLPPRLTEVFWDAFDECRALPLALREPLAALGADLRGSCVGRWVDRKQGVVWQYVVRDGKVWLGGGTDGTPAILGSDSSGDVTLPKTIDGLPVVGLSDYAFLNCTSLVSLHGSRPLRGIGDAVFKGCVRLRSVLLNLDACDFAERDRNEGGTYTANTSFDGCQALESVILGGTGCTRISFAGCRKLRTVILPKGAHTLPSHAYCGCESLRRIVLNTTSCTLGPSAFEGCATLPDIHLPENVTSLPAGFFQGCTSLKRLRLRRPRIPKGCIVEDKVFLGRHMAYRHDCKTNLYWLCETLPDGSLRLGGGTREAPALPPATTGAVTIPRALEGHPVSALAPYAFAGVAITAATLPAPLSCGESLFEGCDKLRKVTLPDGMTVLPPGTFAGCDKLRAVRLPADLRSIGKEAFAWAGLRALELPDSVRTIASMAFHRARLVEIRIPTRVTCLRPLTFADCGRLRRVVLPPGLIAIGRHAFYRCHDLREVNFPAALRGIGYCAFLGCEHFRLPPLPPNLTILESAALGHCISGGQVDIPASVRELPEHLFDSCQDLRILNVASRATKISPNVLPYGAITRIFVAGREIHLPKP